MHSRPSPRTSAGRSFLVGQTKRAEAKPLLSRHDPRSPGLTIRERSCRASKVEESFHERAPDGTERRPACQRAPALWPASVRNGTLDRILFVADTNPIGGS